MMQEREFKEHIAKNIRDCRNQLGLTQSELANRLGYTDKSVSKWERAEAIPDAYVLKKMSELFNVSVDVFIGEDAKTKRKYPRMHHFLTKRAMWCAIAVAICMAAATVVFAGCVLAKASIPKAWLAFVYGVLASCITLLGLCIKWFNLRWQILFASSILWLVALILYLHLGIDKTYVYFIVAGALQLIIVFYSMYKLAKK